VAGIYRKGQKEHSALKMVHRACKTVQAGGKMVHCVKKMVHPAISKEATEKFTEKGKRNIAG